MKKESFLIIINTLEGLKTAAKEQHWIATDLNYHKLVGDVYDTIVAFEDVFVESGIVAIGELSLGDVVPILIPSENIVGTLYAFALRLKTLIPTEPEFANIQTLVDDLITSSSKFVYLSRMS